MPDSSARPYFHFFNAVHYLITKVSPISSTFLLYNIREQQVRKVLLLQVSIHLHWYQIPDMQPRRSRTRRVQPSISDVSDEEEVLYPRYVGAAHSDKTTGDKVSAWMHHSLNISVPIPKHPTDFARFHSSPSSSTQQLLRHTSSTNAPPVQDLLFYQDDLQIRRSPYAAYSQEGWPAPTTAAAGHISYPETLSTGQLSHPCRPSIPTNRSNTQWEVANASEYGRWERGSDDLKDSPSMKDVRSPILSPISSQHRNNSGQLSPSWTPFFQRPSSQSMQMPPANSALSSTSPTYQSTFSANYQTRSPVGSPTHNGEANIHLAPPPKHYRSSSVPSTAPRSGSASAIRSSRPLTGSYTTGTSPNPIFPPLPFSPRIGSPRLGSPRLRRGYWNRRGDHLTTDGYIVYAPLALAYPAELATYPPEEEGYQNDEGAWCAWVMRPELPESLPRMGRAPEAPYESVSGFFC